MKEFLQFGGVIWLTFVLLWAIARIRRIRARKPPPVTGTIVIHDGPPPEPRGKSRGPFSEALVNMRPGQWFRLPCDPKEREQLAKRLQENPFMRGTRVYIDHEGELVVAQPAEPAATPSGNWAPCDESFRCCFCGGPSRDQGLGHRYWHQDQDRRYCSPRCALYAEEEAEARAAFKRSGE